MSVNLIRLGERISRIRLEENLSQEQLAERVNLSREYINRIEASERSPSLQVLVDIANSLHVTADDLLVDSLEHTASTTQSALHRLLLDCNCTEEQIIIATAQEIKKILLLHGI